LTEMEMDDGDHDLIKRLQIVDTLECLGIDRHFEHEIQTAALDYVYRFIRIFYRHFNEFNIEFLDTSKLTDELCRWWNEKGIGEGSRDSLSKDLNATALGFRALRLHRYNVSSGNVISF